MVVHASKPLDTTTPAGVLNINGASITTPDGHLNCTRHGGHWGTDPTCHRCTFPNGTSRLSSEPAYLSLDEFTQPAQPLAGKQPADRKG